jgi:protein-tyrosine phosphatase
MPSATSAAPAPSRPWKRALAWLLLLGPFFFASYGFANWVASHQAEVGVIAFDWERRIPFVAWTIIPYWSIDLLYGLSLLACATRRELDVHARRLLCAQLIAVACFLLFPLRFSFARPEAGGLPGMMFEALAGFDKPFNQAPSLHIALLVILWVLYLRHARGWGVWLLHAWFTLIGVSVLTTYQHHFIDLPTGLWLGWLCVWLFPEERHSLLGTAALAGDPRRRALAARYAAAALGLGAAAVLLGGWGLWLLWPAGSLGLVAVIYLLLDETAFQKRADGSMSAAAWWLLGPYFLGAWLNSRWWTRAMAAAQAVVPGLLLGRLPSRAERDALGVRSVVDVSAELPFVSAGVSYVSVPHLDLTTPSSSTIGRFAEAIDGLAKHSPLLVCCALGLSRSAMAVAGWLIATGRAADRDDAVAQILRARPGVVFTPAHLAALERFAHERSGSAR